MLRLACGAALLAPNGGCLWELFGLVPVVEEVPPELVPVMDSDTGICGDPDELPAMPDGAEAVSDLAALDGCWGTCWRREGVRANLNLVIEVYQTLRFDSLTGTLERFIYQSSWLYATYVDVQIGVVTLDHDGTATFQVLQVLSTIRTGTLSDLSDDYEALPVYEVRLATDGDQLIASFDEIDTPRTSGGFADQWLLRHTRFACP